MMPREAGAALIPAPRVDREGRDPGRGVGPIPRRDPRVDPDPGVVRDRVVDPRVGLDLVVDRRVVQDRAVGPRVGLDHGVDRRVVLALVADPALGLRAVVDRDRRVVLDLGVVLGLGVVLERGAGRIAVLGRVDPVLLVGPRRGVDPDPAVGPEKAPNRAPRVLGNRVRFWLKPSDRLFSIFDGQPGIMYTLSLKTLLV